MAYDTSCNLLKQAYEDRRKIKNIQDHGSTSTGINIECNLQSQT